MYYAVDSAYESSHLPNYYRPRVATAQGQGPIYLDPKGTRTTCCGFKSGACGWVDWNLLLDYTGGPNHLGNDCDAPIHARRDFDGVVVQSYLDVISHFSKHILPGSRRVQADVRGAFRQDAQVTEARASVEGLRTMWPCRGPSSPTTAPELAVDQ